MTPEDDSTQARAEAEAAELRPLSRIININPTVAQDIIEHMGIMRRVDYSRRRLEALAAAGLPEDMNDEDYLSFKYGYNAACDAIID